MSVVNAWQGASTSSGVTVTAKVTGSSTRLLVADNDTLTDAAAVGPVTPTADGIAVLTATGLTSDTRYWWAVEDDSVVDTAFRGEFLTHPPVGEAASYTVWMAGDAGAFPDFPDTTGTVLASDRVSNHPVFGTLRSRALAEGWLMGVHMGDLHYYDLGSNNWGIAGGTSLANYRQSYDDVLAQTNQHDFYRALPIAYTWHNHDFGIPSDGTLPGKENSGIAYRERVSHYPLPAGDNPAFGGPIYYSYQVGRVLWVVLDTMMDRSPQSDPDGPSKTLLGEAQKSWLQALLSTSTAAALVLVSSTVWWAGAEAGTSTWNGYGTEQAEIISMLTSTGYIDRMAMVWADRHSIGIDTGTGMPGGMPGYQFAPLDCSVSTGATWFDTGPEFSERAQYGTMRIDDDGSTITITGTGWRGTESLTSHAFQILDDPTPPPPTPVPAPVGVGAIRRGVTWLSIDDATGRVGHQLDDITGETSRLLMAYTSQKLEYPLTESGPSGIPIEIIRQATEPQQSSIIQIVNDLPMWGGRVLIQDGGSAPKLTLGTATSEQYLLQRRVKTRSYTGVDRALIAADLLTDSGSTDLGPGMALELDVELTGDVIDMTYLASDQITVYAALRDLASAGTMEWTIDLDWVDSRMNAVRRIMRIRRRIGRQVINDRAQFETAGASDCRYQLIRDFSSARYANHVVVYGDGEGEDMPRSDPAIDLLALASGMPIVEAVLHARDTTDPIELNARAAAQLAIMMHGSELWELDSLMDAYPRPGIDAGVGDQVTWGLTSPWHPSPDGVAPGVTGEGRMIGYKSLDAVAGRWSPQLLDPHEELV